MNTFERFLTATLGVLVVSIVLARGNEVSQLLRSFSAAYVDILRALRG